MPVEWSITNNFYICGVPDFWRLRLARAIESRQTAICLEFELLLHQNQSKNEEIIALLKALREGGGDESKKTILDHLRKLTDSQIKEIWTSITNGLCEFGDGLLFKTIENEDSLLCNECVRKMDDFLDVYLKISEPKKSVINSKLIEKPDGANKSGVISNSTYVDEVVEDNLAEPEPKTEPESKVKRSGESVVEDDKKSGGEFRINNLSSAREKGYENLDALVERSYDRVHAANSEIGYRDPPSKTIAMKYCYSSWGGWIIRWKIAEEQKVKKAIMSKIFLKLAMSAMAYTAGVLYAARGVYYDYKNYGISKDDGIPSSVNDKFKNEAIYRKNLEAIRRDKINKKEHLMLSILSYGDIDVLAKINDLFHAEEISKYFNESLDEIIRDHQKISTEISIISRKKSRFWMRVLQFSLAAFAITEIIKTIFEWIAVALGLSHDSFIAKIGLYNKLSGKDLESYVHAFDVLEKWASLVSFIAIMAIILFSILNYRSQIGETEDAEAESPEHHHH
jgi:hypothetical protein